MTLVFLHPIGLDGDCWQYVTPLLGRKSVPYTLLWHGERPEPDQPLSLAAFAADVLAHVPGRLDLVGLSMGGAVAQELAINHPDRVRSVLIACSSAGGNGGKAQWERAAATEATGMAGVLDETMRRWFSPDVLAQGTNPGMRWTRERLLTGRADAFAAAWRALARNNAIAQLHTLRMPATVLHAAQDAAGPLSGKQAMVERIPVSRLRVIPGPHMVQLERPQAFAAEVVDHLAWVDSLPAG